MGLPSLTACTLAFSKSTSQPSSAKEDPANTRENATIATRTVLEYRGFMLLFNYVNKGVLAKA
jgi:hypothetical protein